MKKGIVSLPFPGKGPVDFEKVVKVIKTIISIFKKTSKDTGKTDSIRNDSSLENIDRIIQIFNDFKQQVHNKAVEVENTVQAEVDYYVEELRDLLNDNNDKVVKYEIHIKKIERQIDKISLKIKGTIDTELSRMITLDNSECREIMKMIPGAKKEDAMNRFLDSAIKRALEICCANIHSCLEEIYEDVEMEIIGAIDTIQNNNKYLKEKLSSIDDTNYEKTAKEQIWNSNYVINICDTVSTIL